MKVTNPLTIIAIFAGLAETLATVALIQLPPEIQSIFVYFVMMFPSAIVILFFYVLYFKNTVLYAPSDFENQNHYLEANQIKENISEELDIIFKNWNAVAPRLTKSEINNAKISVGKALDKAITHSPKEKEILDLISASSVTQNEISERLELKLNTASRYLESMRFRGLIKFEDNKWSINV
jgi:DNA-binding CsgD family transcriptional regulator